MLAAGNGHPDPVAVAVAAVTATLALAGAFFGPTVSRAAGRDPDDRALYDALSRMFAAETSRKA